MRALTQLLGLLLLGVCLGGCEPPLTAKRTVAQVGKVEIAEGAFFQILPLSSSGLEGSFNQTVTGLFRGQRQTFLSQVELDSQHMVMVGLATFGARIYTLEYQGERLSFSTIPQLSSKLTPENLLADFQLVNWPVGPIREQFENTNLNATWLTPPRRLQIEETRGHRSISFGGVKVIDITYTQGEGGTREVVLQNLDRDYTLHITQYQEIEF